MRYELYEDESIDPNDKDGTWRWRTRATNGKVTGGSEESFHSEGNARRAAKAHKKSVANAEIVTIKKDKKA